MTERAATWVRVSSGQQDEASQVPEVNGYAVAHGYDVVKRYTLHDRSAFHGEQQAALDAVLADLRAGLFTVLVIWHSDRLERREGKALLDVLAEISAAGGRVESVREPLLGQLDFGGQVTTFLAGLMNHEKSRHLAEQVGLAHARIRANGGYLGRPPFGYRRAGGKYDPHLAPDPETRHLAAEAFGRIAAGESLGAVGTWLAEQTGRAWWPSAVAAMIRNPAYRGTVQDATGRITHRCEPLVTGELWAAANASLAGRPKRGTHHAEDSSLSGILRCIGCAGPVYRIRGGGGWYYRCVGYGPRRKSTCRMMVRCEAANSLVDGIMSTLTRPVITWELIKGHDHAAGLADVDLALRDLVSQGLDEDAEDAERAALRAERARLRALPVVPDEWVPVESSRTYADEWRELAPAARRDWLKRYAPRLYLGKPGMEAALFAAEDEDSPGRPGERATYHTGHGAVLVIVWKAA